MILSGLTPRNTAATPPGAIGPVSEQLSLQQEAGQLLIQIEQAHALLDMLYSIGQSPSSSSPSELPNLATSIHMARSRMDELIERLEGTQRVIGQL